MTTVTAPRMSRSPIAAALAMACTLATFAVTAEPATAAPRGGAYAAVLASPLPQPRSAIVDGVVWRCQGDRCAAPADGGRVQTVCSKVSRRFGELARFATPQGDLAAAELARCNAG